MPRYIVRARDMVVVVRRYGNGAQSFLSRAGLRYNNTVITIIGRRRVFAVSYTFYDVFVSLSSCQRGRCGRRCTIYRPRRLQNDTIRLDNRVQ